MLNFIVNCKSGKGRGLKNTKKIVDYCMKNGVDYTLYFTTKKGHATEITRAITTAPCATVVAVGGDGTFHEVLNGIVDTENTTLGFIPSGRGNDFARSMNLKTDPIKALEDILRGEKTKIDYIQVGENLRCLNVCGTGLDVEVLHHVEGKTNKISYLVSLLDCITHFNPYKVTVSVNGETYNYDNCIMAGVCNGGAFGGNIKVSPLSRVDDGKIDVIIITIPSSGKVLPVVPKFVAGKHMGMEITHHFVCDEVKIDGDYAIELDGEIYENAKLHCSIKAGAITTFSTK